MGAKVIEKNHRISWKTKNETWNLKTLLMNNEDTCMKTRNLQEKRNVFETQFYCLKQFSCPWNLKAIYIGDLPGDGQIK